MLPRMHCCNRTTSFLTAEQSGVAPDLQFATVADSDFAGKPKSNVRRRKAPAPGKLDVVFEIGTEGEKKMSQGMPSMTALLGMVALAGYQNRDKITEMLTGDQTSGPNTAASQSGIGRILGSLGGLLGG